MTEKKFNEEGYQLLKASVEQVVVASSFEVQGNLIYTVIRLSNGTKFEVYNKVDTFYPNVIGYKLIVVKRHNNDVILVFRLNPHVPDSMVFFVLTNFGMNQRGES